MADSTYAVKVSDEVKDRLQKLIDESGLSSKEFFVDMVSQFELMSTKKQAPMLSADIDEMVKLTTRMNNIFINVGERVSSLQEAYRLEAEGVIKEKESLISLLQQQSNGLKRDAAEAEMQASALVSENEALRKETAKIKSDYLSEVDQLKAVNQKNDVIIAGHNEKIDTLSGLVSKYKGYAEENEDLKRKALETQQSADECRRANERLNVLLVEKENQIQSMKSDNEARLNELGLNHSQDMERLREKLELDKTKALLEQREQYNRELDAIRDKYQEKINQLLQLGRSKP